MKVLISGFETFDGLDTNPSEQLVELLLLEQFEFELTGVILPVSFEKSFKYLQNEIDSQNPDFVIGFGLAQLRDEITPERIAINLKDARIPDNDGNQPRGMRILENREDGLFSSLPVEVMVKAAHEANVKSSVSNTAGTYVCNDLMFRIIAYGKQKGYQGGFIHIPPTPEIQLGPGSMELSQITKGIIEMLKSLHSIEADKKSGG